MEAARSSRIDAQQRKKVRDEIISEMEKVYQRMQADKEEMRKRMQADKDELRKRLSDVEKAQDAADKALEWSAECVEKMEAKLEKLEKSTAEAMRRTEEQAKAALANVENRMDVSAKHLQNITHAVVAGFGMMLLSVLILFITLLVKI